MTAPRPIAAPPGPAPGYESILCDALLAAHGGRARLRLLGDEGLYRARLALWRAQFDALDALDERGARAATTTALALALARGAVEDEEARRERGRHHGIPRDTPGSWVPASLVREIRARVSPVEVFHRWGLTELRETRAGKWVGKCPFHDDDSPSLCVYTDDPADMHWHCFGCQAHGDVFDLAKRHTGRSFRACCEGLASGAGIPWPAPPAVVRPNGGRPGGLPILHPKRGV